MTLAVRLDPALEREFEARCRIERTTKSAVVTELIRGYVRRHAPVKSPFELAEEMGLIGWARAQPLPQRQAPQRLARQPA